MIQVYAVEIPSSPIIFLSSFMKVGTGVQAILRFRLSNLDGCNIGITNGRYLRSVSLEWAQVA
jgi:hypothetical protein